MQSVRVINIPEDVEEAEIEKYFTDNFHTKSKVISFTQQLGHATSAVVAFENNDVVEKVLKSQHKDYKFTVIPEIYQQILISDLWIKTMEKNKKDYSSFLKNACQNKNVTVTHTNDKCWLKGDSESLLKTLTALNSEYEKLFVDPRQGMIDNGRDDTRVFSSVHSDRDHPNTTQQHHACPSGDDVKSTPSDDASQSKEGAKARTRKLKENADSNSGNTQASDEQKNPSRIRVLRTKSQDNTNMTGFCLFSKCQVAIPNEAKHFSFSCHKSNYLISKRNKLVDEIRSLCSFLAVVGNGDDDCNWYYIPRSEEHRVEERLVVLAGIEPVTDCITVPQGFDQSSLELLFTENRNHRVSLKYEESDRMCVVHGFDVEDVNATIAWLEQMLCANIPVTHCPEFSSKQRESSRSPQTLWTMKSSSDRLDVESRSNLSIHVYQGDMLHQQTEVIVNSANDQLAHGGGLARAILSAGGQEIDVESRKIIKERGKLSMGDVVHTTAGNLPPPVRFVIHAVPPNQYQMDTRNKDECSEALIKVFYHSMTYANDTLHAKSISLPPFGAGIFKVPVKVIIQAAYKALQQYDNYVERSKSSEITLKEIHFISNDLNVTREIITAFKSLMS